MKRVRGTASAVWAHRVKMSRKRRDRSDRSGPAGDLAKGGRFGSHGSHRFNLRGYPWRREALGTSKYMPRIEDRKHREGR